MKPATPPAAPPDDAADVATPQTGRRASKATTARTEGGARRLFNVHEAAEFLGVSRSYLRRLVSGGAIKRVRLPALDGHGRTARLWRVDRDDLAKLVEQWKKNVTP